MAGGQAFGEPTIRRYYEDRNHWELEVQRWTSILDRHVARRTSEVKVCFGLDNAGASSAENLVVELKTNEGLSLGADDEAADELLGNLSPPSPPEPPKIRPSFDITNLGVSLAQPAPRRNPTAMSWIDRPRPGASRASYGCEDSRPGRKYEDAALAIRSTEADGGLVRIEASANHMPARAVELQMRFEDASVEWTDERVLAAFPPDVAEAVRAESC